MEKQYPTIKQYVKQHEGLVISEATIKLDDLLASAHSIITGKLRFPGNARRAKTLAYEIKTILGTDDMVAFRVFHNEHNQDYDQEAAGYLWEDVFQFFNDVAPAGYHFSSHEGDGACFGFWQDEKEDF